MARLTTHWAFWVNFYLLTEVKWAKKNVTVLNNEHMLYSAVIITLIIIKKKKKWDTLSTLTMGYPPIILFI